MRNLVLVVLLVAAGTADLDAMQREPKRARTDNPDAQRVIDLLEHQLTAERIVPGEVIVKFREGAAIDPAAMLGPLSADTQVRQTSGSELVVRLTGPQFDPQDAGSQDRTLEVIAELENNPDILWAHPNYMLQIVRDPNDDRFDEQWHYREAAAAAGGLDLPDVWDQTLGAADVVVAVIDTGILPNHPDIQGSANLLAGFDMITDPAVANDGGGREADPTDPGDAVVVGECGTDILGRPVPDRDRDDSWHGSHVAGTVGVGRTDNNIGVAGVNWNVSVVPVRVLGKCGGSIADINDGIRWAAGLSVPGVPDNANPADVINLSLGGLGTCSNSPATQSAIDDAVDAGATVVVAAGNEAQDSAGFLPASCDNIITVAASDLRGRLAQRYSNFGAGIDIMAPGGDVLRDDNNDGNPDGVLSYVDGGYDFYNGTSMAAPHVAGVAALMLAVRPDLTPAEVETHLKDNARDRNSTQCPRACGEGLLDPSFISDAAFRNGSGPVPDTPTDPVDPKEPDKVPAMSTVWQLLAVALVLTIAWIRRGA